VPEFAGDFLCVIVNWQPYCSYSVFFSSLHSDLGLKLNNLPRGAFYTPRDLTKHFKTKHLTNIKERFYSIRCSFTIMQRIHGTISRHPVVCDCSVSVSDCSVLGIRLLGVEPCADLKCPVLKLQPCQRSRNSC
jgi:hypothetical protein